MTEIPDINTIANDILIRTHSYCVDFPVSQQAIVKNQIDSISLRLSKSIDASEIMKLATALKILYDLYNSLHERSTITFMAQYSPLSNLIETMKSSAPLELSDTTPALPDTPKNDLANIDIEGLYKKYED